MLIKYYKTEDAKTPEKASIGASGLDLCSTINWELKPGDRKLIHTGIHLDIPLGFEGQIRSRSGLAIKYGVFVLNGIGTIDSDYTGDIGVILYNAGSSPFIINKGDRIAQLVIAPVMLPTLEKVEHISMLKETERKGKGFGSTGIKEI